MLITQMRVGFVLFYLFGLCSPFRIRRDTQLTADIRKQLRELQSPWEQSGYYQGDIRLDKGLRNIYREEKDMFWPNGVVPYEISSKFNAVEKRTIEESIADLSRQSCLKFPRRKKSDKYGIVFLAEKGKGCNSVIGFIKTENQEINLDPTSRCVQLGTIQHEILHALGLLHQHSARNRDNYIQIVFENVKTGKESNFNTEKDLTTDMGFEYDYNSIMHYGKYAFSKNGKETIIPKDKKATIGQRVKLSDIDIKKIKKMYKCA